jgi:hypothetical protein
MNYIGCLRVTMGNIKCLQNAEDLDLNLHRCENLKISSFYNY